MLGQHDSLSFHGIFLLLTFYLFICYSFLDCKPCADPIRSILSYFGRFQSINSERLAGFWLSLFLQRPSYRSKTSILCTIFPSVFGLRLSGMSSSMKFLVFKFSKLNTLITPSQIWLMDLHALKKREA